MNTTIFKIPEMGPLTKLLVVLFCFACSVVGFMLKLPSAFRPHDKLLHSAFYFLAAAFLHILFQKRVLLIAGVLFLFGISIEYLQEFSNKYTGKRIHGRFDIEDVYANSKGLILYLGIWFTGLILKTIFNYFKPAKRAVE